MELKYERFIDIEGRVRMSDNCPTSAGGRFDLDLVDGALGAAGEGPGS